MRFTAAYCVILICLFFTSANASGIIGQAFKDLGNLVGSQEIKDAGEALDNAHRDIKDRNKIYKQIEEGSSKFVRDQFRPLCTAPFQAITNWTIARCANWPGRTNNSWMLNDAKELLIDSGVFSSSDFRGIDIRWCPLSGAHGMAPDRGKILIDTPFMHGSIEELSIVLAHEMKHIQQYRQMGTDNFKCRYSRLYVECGGCQDSRHPLEREAYDFEESVYDEIYDYYGKKPKISVVNKIDRGRIAPLITDNCNIQGTLISIDEFDNVYPHGRRVVPPMHPMCAFDIWPANSSFAYCVNRMDGAVLTQDRFNRWVSVGVCRPAWW